jgi:hypothetical protein
MDNHGRQDIERREEYPGKIVLGYLQGSQDVPGPPAIRIGVNPLLTRKANHFLPHIWPTGSEQTMEVAP